MNINRQLDQNKDRRLVTNRTPETTWTDITLRTPVDGGHILQPI